MNQLTSRLEKHALKAEDLDAFSGLKLAHVKKAIADALKLIGRNGLFEQYTTHDISHIDRMLDMSSWLIPETTWKKLTPSDSLLQVLSIYLHDLGMLTTKQEYDNRENSGWREFVEELYSGDGGDDYRAKVETLGTGEGERFLYQEYVRANHGERVRSWITGTPTARLGEAKKTAALVASLLEPLPTLFREDLGLVCESHHKSDLGNIDAYPVSRPYGQSVAEAANVQYAAFLLRTADLLHITSDRTPSVLFRLIAPSDPVSQEEWAKQAAVTAVRSKPAVDDEGNVDIDADRDTIEVVAQFSDEDGFFGLTAYLSYASSQLRQTYDWADTSVRKYGSTYTFPWKYLDENQILTNGFLRDTFEFSLDTKRVLDLLTGHTLYNNTSVVLRELVQNSLDAIRVQRLGSSELQGHVKIDWNSESRELSVLDNGTGMSQDVIERHLLRVGSSRYQDPEFQRRHPTFSPISRFGIGVLSAFMVADAVSVSTVHPDDHQGRQLNLRSVHGRYLVRLFEKDDPEYAALGSHGTRVTLALRPSADIGDITEVLRSWILVPGCQVSLSIDGGDPMSIGYAQIGDALKSRVEEDGWVVQDGDGDPDDREIRVSEVSSEGVDLAFATRWSAHFREWSLVPIRKRESETPKALGTAVEGIRVEQGTPGFREPVFHAMANATGLSAPRTDVSRSGLELTPERLNLLSVVYRQFAGFIRAEVDDLRSRGFSLTWSAKEAVYLSGPLVRGRAEDDRRLNEAVASIPSVVVDDGNERRLLTPAEVEDMEVFWTIESNFFRSAEMLLREMPSTASITAITKALGVKGFQIPAGPLVTSASVPQSGDHLLASREVSRIIVDQEQRRVDLAWEAGSETPRWVHLLDRRSRRLAARASSSLFASGERGGRLEVGYPGSIDLSGAQSQTAVRGHNRVFLLPESALGAYLRGLLDRCKEIDADLEGEVRLAASSITGGLFGERSEIRIDTSAAVDYIERMVSQGNTSTPDILKVLDAEEFGKAIAADVIRIFDPWAWDRSQAGG